LDHLPARLGAFLQSLPNGSQILIPGCGEDSKTIDAFGRAGHQVTAIDFSPVAIEYMQKALPKLRDRIIFGNFFTHDLGRAAFDLVYERTFLCSLPPRLWNDYAERVAELLNPRGLLAGFFFYGEEPDPPPYPLTESKASELFDARFDLRTSEAVTDSLSIFAGQEKWQERQLRS
jgi:cyclopropane fatty-acyl-phospholipid synthase-like methyltransferase